MSRPNGVVDERFDEAGFEVPFSGSYEGELIRDSETTFGAEADTPFAESTFEGEGVDGRAYGAESYEADSSEGEGSEGEVYEGEGYEGEGYQSERDESESLEESDSSSEADSYEAPVGEDETYPSGLVLRPASGATGRDQEHWDPTNSGNPLLATGPDVQSQKISSHFTVRELVTSGGKAAPIARISPELVRVLDLIRVRAGKPVKITSGYRSWARNKQIYAARGKKPTDSQHCSGQAADISVGGMSGLALGKIAIDATGRELGIGIGNTFIHVDVRPTFTVWTYYPKGGEADRKARAAITAHFAGSRGGRRVPTPPLPVPPLPVPPRPQPAPAGGRSGRLVVAQHPMLRSHTGTSPDLILRWHNIAQPGVVDVVVHFHGYGHTGQKGGVRIDRDKERISGLDFSDPASPGAAGRTRPTLGILPRGNYFGGSGERAYNFPALTPAGAIQKLIQDALARVTRATGHSVQMGRLILTGHSGGGAPLSALLAHTDPDEVHVFDGLYGPSTRLSEWAQRRIARDLASPAALAPAMRVLYRPLGPKSTQPSSEALARQLFPALSSPAAARLRPYFRVEKTDVGHNDIPGAFGWRLLADPGANVPRATLFSAAPRVTREATFESYDESAEAFEPETFEGEDAQFGADETLAWLDVEALTGDVGEHEGEAEGAWEAEVESIGEWEGEAEADSTEGEWGEAEAENEDEAIVERFDAFGDERDSEWELSEDEAMFEDEGPLATSGLTTAEQNAIEITSLFETGKRGGFFGLAGNFDGQGLSFGLVNWTVGTGSLQPLLRDFAREQPARWAQAFGPHAAGFLAVMTPKGNAAIKVQHRFAIDQMNEQKIVKGKLQWAIREPWVTYFKRLSEDREFQQIQIRYVRVLLKRGDFFCKHFNLKSEMSFAYMFDASASHGQAWLTKKFGGQEKRRMQIEQKIGALTAQHGQGRVPEGEILLAIADVLAATSAARWANNVRTRKRWFVTGQHPRAKELKGLEPRASVPYTTSGGLAVVPKPAPGPVPSPAPAPAPATDVGAKIARIAEAELVRWHPGSRHMKETEADAVPLLQKYWAAVGERPTAAQLQNRAWQAKHFWSAAFISWVMKQAGANGFKFSNGHRIYVGAAKRNRLNNVTSNPFWAYRPTEVAPQVGDLICNSRTRPPATYDNIDDGTPWGTHCDIVTAVRPGSIRVIGGNVRDDVRSKTRRALPDGRVALDGDQGVIYAVVRCRGQA